MNKTILIIDDDDMLRKTLASGLRAEGFHVLTADSGENAKQVLQRISSDAIILDRMMSGIDGLSFLKEIRHNGNNTPVIMLTAMSGAENTIDGLINGANDYLAKPFQFKELVLRLNNIIKNTPIKNTPLPHGLLYIENNFFIQTHKSQSILQLSDSEKELLYNLTHPIGNIVSSQPMIAKRLRTKLNSVLSNLDIITIRGHGYKIIYPNNKKQTDN